MKKTTRTPNASASSGSPNLVLRREAIKLLSTRHLARAAGGRDDPDVLTALCLDGGDIAS